VGTEGLGDGSPPAGSRDRAQVEVWGPSPQEPDMHIAYNLQWTNAFSCRAYRRYTVYLQAHVESVTPTPTLPKRKLFEFVQISRPTLA